VRISTDLSDQRMNAKIRSAQNQKIPYMIILGDKERSSGNISLRTRGGDQFQELSIEKFLAMLHDG
jgi:threonyl-tRNA synthetase